MVSTSPHCAPSPFTNCLRPGRDVWSLLLLSLKALIWRSSLLIVSVPCMPWPRKMGVRPFRHAHVLPDKPLLLELIISCVLPSHARIACFPLRTTHTLELGSRRPFRGFHTPIRCLVMCSFTACWPLLASLYLPPHCTPGTH